MLIKRPTEYDNLEVPFGIDDEVRQLAKNRPPKITLVQQMPAAIRIARRAIEVATVWATMADDNEAEGAWIEDWEFIAKHFSEAQDSVQRLRRTIAPRPSISLSHVLRQIESKLEPGDLERQFANAEKGAGILILMDEYLARVAPVARGHATKLRTDRRNLGSPQKLRFAGHIAEAWVFLTGRFPGTSRTYDTNPFLKFLSVAWNDAQSSSHSKTAKTDKEGFYHAAMQANEAVRLKAANGPLRFVPEWL